LPQPTARSAFTLEEGCTGGWQLAHPLPSRAYGPEFGWDNGTTASFASRERPQIVLEVGEGGSGAPVFLSNGIITAGWTGHSFTLVAPVNNSGWQ
jgi:hypothetical protein